jgi:hypothetical protein
METRERRRMPVYNNETKKWEWFFLDDEDDEEGF